VNVDDHRYHVRYQRNYRVGDYDISSGSFRRLRCGAEDTSELWLDDTIIDVMLSIFELTAGAGNYFFTSLFYSKVCFNFVLFL